MGLPWFRVDSNFASSPQMIELLGRGLKGRAAAFSYVASMGYCADHGTDGRIPRGAVMLLSATAADAKLLVEVGLWSETDAGYLIPDWAERQQTAATTEALKKMRSEAGRKGAAARWEKG